MFINLTLNPLLSNLNLNYTQMAETAQTLTSKTREVINQQVERSASSKALSGSSVRQSIHVT